MASADEVSEFAMEAVGGAGEWDAVSAMSGHCTSPKRSDARRRGFPVPGVAIRAEMTEPALRARRGAGGTSEWPCAIRRRNEQLSPS